MKYHLFKLPWGIPLMLAAYLAGSAPSAAQHFQLTDKASLPLKVNHSQTIAISFPYGIRSVDLGSRQLLAKKAAGAENVLLVKAATDSIAPTSLIVLTSDGTILSFQVSCQSGQIPTNLVILPDSVGKARPHALLSGANQAEIQNQVDRAQQLRQNLNRHTSNQGVSATLEGIYVIGQRTLVRLSIENRSKSDYRLSAIRFFSCDKTRAKRTSSQQVELPVIFQQPSSVHLLTGQQQTVVVVLPQQSFEGRKYLSVQIFETQSHRNLRINIRAKDLRSLTTL